MCNYSKEFLGKTIKVWQPYSSASLSLENAREIAESITGFLLLLSKWGQTDGQKEKKVSFKPHQNEAIAQNVKDKK